MWWLRSSWCWKCCSNITPITNLNRILNRRGWQRNENEWLPNRINVLPNVPNVPNEASQCKDWISIRWLTLYGTTPVRQNLTYFWTLHAQISTLTATLSHPVDPTKSNTRSLIWTPGAITGTRHLDRNWWQTIQNGRATFLRNSAHAYRSSTSFHRRWLRITGIRIDAARR